MPRLSKEAWAALIAAIFLVAGAAMWWETFRETYHLSRAGNAMGPAFFPRLALTGICLLAIAAIVDGWRRAAPTVRIERASQVAGAIAATTLYCVGILWIGFLLATIAFVLLLPPLLGYRRWPVLAPVAIGYAIIVWYVFQNVLLIILPASPWFISF
jgi:hypothetical protein